MRETWIEVRLIGEDDLKAFAAGKLDRVTREAIEAYLLHHPRAARRVDAYRRGPDPARPCRPIM